MICPSIGVGSLRALTESFYKDKEDKQHGPHIFILATVTTLYISSIGPLIPLIHYLSR